MNLGMGINQTRRIDIVINLQLDTILTKQQPNQSQLHKSERDQER